MSILKSFLGTFDFFLYEVGGLPVMAWVILGCIAVFLIRRLIKENRQKKKNGSEDEETEPTTKEAKPTEEPESKKPAVPKKPWPKNVKVGIVVSALVLGAVAAFLAFDVQLPDVRFSNAAFWVFFPIVLLAGFLALSSNRKKALRVPLILFLGMALVFWHFDVSVLLIADQDKEMYGYNPMDFEPAVPGLGVTPRSVMVNASAPAASVFFSLTVKHVERC